jgi:predicted Fe-Mo cluster-binding NifX family protein
MKIAVSSSGEKLDAQVDPRFGRCQYFVIVDPDTMEFEAISNTSAMASGGAGIQAAQNVANQGANIVITGNVGPNAFQTLNAAGLKIITGATGTVEEVIKKYKNGELQETEAANVNSHFGMGRGGGRGGGGRGMGGGRNR